MSFRAGTPRRTVLMLALAGVLALAGCGGSAPAARPPDSGPTQATTAPPAARAQLAARAAAAQDRRMLARYRLTTPDHPDRILTVVLAADGTWRVDAPGLALGGTADVAVVRSGDGLYQCGLPSTGRPLPAACVRVAGADGRIDAAYDPRVQHPFTDWPAVFTDRLAALAVSPAQPPPGVPGSCFSVESSSASLAAPLDLGIYCYQQDGTLTSAPLGSGTLVLDGAPAPAPATAPLPGAVVGGEPLTMAAPPTPSAAAPAGTATPD